MRVTAGAACIVLALDACGSGGSHVPALSGGAGAATLAIHLGMSASANAQKRPARISPAANGVAVTVYFHSDSKHAAIVGSEAFDVSASSQICTSSPLGRTCTLDIPAPVPPSGDSDDVTVQTYDSAPSAGGFPPSAKLLDNGLLHVTPVAGEFLNVSVTLAGVPASASVTIDNPYAKYSASLYGGLSYNVEVTAYDASGAAIIGADPFAQAIGLTASSGAILVNGAPASALASPGDTVTFVAPAAGAGGSIDVPGLGGTAPFAASALGAKTLFNGGANVANYLAAGNDGLLYASSPTAVYAFDPANPGSVQTIAAPAGFTFQGITQSAPGASYLAATAAATDGTGADFAQLATGFPAQIVSGKSVSVGSIGQPVFVNGVAFVTNGMAVCSATACQSTAGVANQAVDGPDGNLWLAEGDGVSRMIVAGATIAQYVRYTSGLPPGANVVSIANAPDGNMYFLDAGTSAIGKITTAGTITETPFAGITTTGNIVAGPDRAMWFCAGTSVGRYDISSGTIAQYLRPRNVGIDISTAHQLWLALGADGAIWSVDSFKKLERITP